jgi:hypothetical protein
MTPSLCVPLENNLFTAAAAAGLFGHRQGYVGPSCAPSAPPPTAVGPTVPGAPDHLLTSVSVLDVGPDLQLIANPGESFPALMVGSPWTFDGVPSECQGRANPGVPTWRSHALYRFQVGLANDMLGYEIPAWAFISAPGAFSTSDPNCATTDINGDFDSKNHHHKLETEGAGPTASNMVADGLTALVGGDSPDPAAHVVHGRYVKPDGSYSQFPEGATGILTAPSSALDPQAGTLVGSPTTAAFGGRAVDANGFFMDYDGQPQPAPDVTTRGMMVLDASGCVVARYYLDEFPSLDGSKKLGAAVSQSAVTPTRSCTSSGPTPGIQPAGSVHFPRPGCVDRTAPTSVIARRPRVRHGRLSLRGRSSDRGCAGRVARVTVTLGKRVRRGRCRFVGTNGKLGARRSCRHGVLLLAHGTGRWRFRVRLPRGRYVAIVRAVDTAGNLERARRRGRNVAHIRR